MIFNKKGAMFGLDARIALAIFGALSVISGAALFSAIQNAKVTSLIVELTEVNKAIEQYYLDNGSFIPVYETNFYQSGELVKNTQNLSTWKGPYISHKHGVYRSYLNHLEYAPAAGNGFAEAPNGLISIVKSKDSVAWTHWLTPISNLCSSGSDCFYWVAIAGFKDKTILSKVDEAIDGVVGDSTGNVRIFYHASTGYSIHYKMMNSLD